MKFYKRFPGDITIKTGDLSLIEFGAYDRLLDHFYAKEQPIDPARVYTVARCQSVADRRAVDMVLAEFWTLTVEGWVQQRAEEMIAEALPRIEAARVNGKKGGRPKRTQNEPTGFCGETQKAEKSKASQSQSSLSPSEKRTGRPTIESVAVADLVAEGFDEKTAIEFIECKAERKAPLTERAWNDHLLEAKKAGWTPLQAAEKVMAKTWKGFESKYVADEARASPQSKSFRQQDAQAAQEVGRKWMGSLATRLDVFEMEAPNAARISND